ncbi:MAG: hypothetical protein Q3M24_16170 [Candidatus Electrothrix aestuarii]|uniref:WD domain-containing protein, G-beta repeat-containing protein n=1 Tax=Candidatus Electrothrix aestuarii TaxID=3062594 RepID=A0AAU8LSE5_9BACT|nr:hypothetical protein [Candidatus Electrothrix aestuarii]
MLRDFFYLRGILKHESTVMGAVFNKDETRILTWSDDSTARIWDAASGQPIAQPLKHEDRVTGAVFNKDETRILTWSRDKTARIWDAASGQPIAQPLKHEGPVWGAVFNKDETRILTWSIDKTARIWDAASGQPIAQPLKHEDSVIGAVFNKDETRILTWSDDKTARIWDISVDAAWPSDQIVLKVEVETGTEMTDTDEVLVLSAAEWQQKKWCEYDKIQYELERISQEEWQESQRLCEQLKASTPAQQQAAPEHRQGE